jgi:hypothetical protein
VGVKALKIQVIKKQILYSAHLWKKSIEKYIKNALGKYLVEFF